VETYLSHIGISSSLRLINPEVGSSKSPLATKSFGGLREFWKNETKTFQRESASLLKKNWVAGIFGKESSSSRPGILVREGRWRRVGIGGCV
jgi:hypothetical protein